jgi:uncharacterized protein GlcG (DUF336 family)
MSASVQHVPSITSSAARAVIEAAVAAAEQTSQRFAVAVVDAAGVLSAFARMDGAPLQASQIAQDKAYTAVSFGMPTDQWHEFIQGDAPLTIGAPTGIDRLITFGGGYPLLVDGVVVGAIGVSGGHWSDDMNIAQAGAKALA